MKKIITVFLFTLFLISCSSKQDLGKLEEFNNQYKKFSTKVANSIYGKKQSSFLSGEEKDFEVKNAKEIYEEGKMLLENGCPIIVKNDLQNDCKDVLGNLVEVYEKLQTEKYLSVKEKYESFTEKRKKFKEDLNLYLKEQKLK